MVSKNELLKLFKRVKLIVFDFDGVFTDNRVLVMQDGREGVFCSRSDGLGIKMLNKTGVKLRVISAENNPVVKARCKKLRLVCIQGCKDKLRALEKEMKLLGVSSKETAYVGNDVNDLECLRTVFLPIGVANSRADIVGAVKYITENEGGNGAVRELCDLVLEVEKRRSKK